MADLWEEIAAKLRDLSANWTAYTVLGSFLLYLLGYLSLRFHLTVLGIATDFFVLDERYLFTGAKFVIQVLTSVPNLVLLVLMLVTPPYLTFRLLPTSWRERVGARVRGTGASLWSWWSDPLRLAMSGIVLTVLSVQFFMRQCFSFSNLLLASELPSDQAWLRYILLAEDDGIRELYFCGLIASAAMSSAILLALWNRTAPNGSFRRLRLLLGLLVTAQVLFIPINYGMLILEKTMPRVKHVGDETTLHPGAEAWLVWEGKAGMTFLIREHVAGKEARALVTLPQQDVKKVQVIGYDRILQVLFADKGQ